MTSGADCQLSERSIPGVTKLVGPLSMFTAHWVHFQNLVSLLNPTVLLVTSTFGDISACDVVFFKNWQTSGVLKWFVFPQRVSVRPGKCSLHADYVFLFFSFFHLFCFVLIVVPAVSLL